MGSNPTRSTNPSLCQRETGRLLICRPGINTRMGDEARRASWRRRPLWQYASLKDEV